MLNVNGQAYVTNLREVSPKLVVGDVYCHQKVSEEEFITTFVKAKFVGDALIHIMTQGVKNKDKVFIDSSVLKANKYTNKEGKEISSLEMTIFELDKYEEEDMPIQDIQIQDLKQNRFKRK